MPILKGIAETMRNRPFLLLTLSVTLMFFGFYASSALGMYLNIYYIFGGVEKDASTYVGLSGTLWKVSSLAALPVIVLISRRFDKRNTFVVSMILSLFGAVGGWWCIDPERPWLQVLPSILYGPGISCVLMLCDSMLADICDLDELRGGVRREAMFGAIYGWFTKVGLTIALALSGLLLVCTGFDVKFGAGQPEGTVFLMRVLAVTVPASGMLTAILLMAGYRLNAGRMAEVSGNSTHVGAAAGVNPDPLSGRGPREPGELCGSGLRPGFPAGSAAGRKARVSSSCSVISPLLKRRRNSVGVSPAYLRNWRAK